MVCHYCLTSHSDNTSIVAHLAVSSGAILPPSVITHLPIPEYEQIRYNLTDLTSNLAHRGAGNVHEDSSMLVHHVARNDDLYQPGVSILSHLAPVLPNHFSSQSNLVANLNIGSENLSRTQPYPSMIPHHLPLTYPPPPSDTVIPIFDHHEPSLLGTMIPHQTSPLIQPWGSCQVSSVSHRVNSEQFEEKQPE